MAEQRPAIIEDAPCLARRIAAGDTIQSLAFPPAEKRSVHVHDLHTLRCLHLSLLLSADLRVDQQSHSEPWDQKGKVTYDACSVMAKHHYNEARDQTGKQGQEDQVGWKWIVVECLRLRVRVQCVVRILWHDKVLVAIMSTGTRHARLQMVLAGLQMAESKLTGVLSRSIAAGEARMVSSSESGGLLRRQLNPSSPECSYARA